MSSVRDQSHSCATAFSSSSTMRDILLTEVNNDSEFAKAGCHAVCHKWMFV